MKKVPCKRCNSLIQEKTALKYNGYSNYCLKMHLQEEKTISKSIVRKKNLIDLEIEQEQILYNLDKSQKEQKTLEKLFASKKNNKENVVQVLNNICINILGQSLVEVLV